MADHQIDIVPFFFLHAHQQQHQIRTNGKIRGIVGNDECVEMIAGSAGFQGLQNQPHDVGSERIHLAVELDAANSVAEVDE